MRSDGQIGSCVSRVQRRKGKRELDSSVVISQTDRSLPAHCCKIEKNLSIVNSHCGSARLSLNCSLLGMRGRTLLICVVLWALLRDFKEM